MAARNLNTQISEILQLVHGFLERKSQLALFNAVRMSK